MPAHRVRGSSARRATLDARTARRVALRLIGWPLLAFTTFLAVLGCCTVVADLASVSSPRILADLPEVLAWPMLVVVTPVLAWRLVCEPFRSTFTLPVERALSHGVLAAAFVFPVYAGIATLLAPLGW